MASGATVGEAVKAAAALAAQKGPRESGQRGELEQNSAGRFNVHPGHADRWHARLTVHDAQPHALGHRVAEAINHARKLGRKPGILLKSLGANVSPLSNHVGSGTTEENYRRNQLDAAGIAAVAKQLLKK